MQYVYIHHKYKKAYIRGLKPDTVNDDIKSVSIETWISC